jgi:hypothetical protein
MVKNTEFFQIQDTCYTAVTLNGSDSALMRSLLSQTFCGKPQSNREMSTMSDDQQVPKQILFLQSAVKVDHA